MKSLHRRNPRRDLVEPAIVDALLAHGFSVTRPSAKGCPDLLLGRNGRTCVAEVKSGGGKLTPDQIAWWTAWRGNGAVLLRTLADVHALAATW